MDYRVTFSRVLRVRLEALAEQARNEGRKGQVMEAARLIEAGFRTNPHSAGELEYHLPTGIPVYHIVSGPLSAYVAIFTAARHVEIFRFDLLSARNN